MNLWTAIITTLIVSIIGPSASARAETLEFHCAYGLFGAPFADVILTAVDGVVQDRARVLFQGRQSEESVTNEPVDVGERFHVWLSKESSENSLELIIYEQATEKGDSKLINHHMPALKEMWGKCRVQSVAS